MKTIIYIRVSTTMQVDNGHSIENQLQRLKKYCEQNSLDNIIVLKDEGLSGTNTNRPSYQKLLGMVQANQVKNVVVYSLSRFARNLKTTIEAVDLFNKNGVVFHSLSEKIDTNSAMGNFFIQIIASIAQLESSVTAERISSVLQNRKSNGFRTGGIPFGYDVDANKKLVPNKSELHTIQLIKELRDKKNFTFMQISKELQKMKRPNKNGNINWSTCSVYRVCNNSSNQKYL